MSATEMKSPAFTAAPLFVSVPAPPRQGRNLHSRERIRRRVVAGIGETKIRDAEDVIGVLSGRYGLVGARRRFVDVDYVDRKIMRAVERAGVSLNGDAVRMPGRGLEIDGG